MTSMSSLNHLFVNIPILKYLNIHNLDGFHDFAVVVSNSQSKQSNLMTLISMQAWQMLRARYGEFDVPRATKSSAHLWPSIALSSHSQRPQYLLRDSLSQQDGIQECL